MPGSRFASGRCYDFEGYQIRSSPKPKVPAEPSERPIRDPTAMLPW
jgi:hypothetical protein